MTIEIWKNNFTINVLILFYIIKSQKSYPNLPSWHILLSSFCELQNLQDMSPEFYYFQTIFCKEKFDIFFFGVFVFKFDYAIVWKNLNIKISICVFAQSTMSQNGRGAVEIMDMLFVIPFPWDNYLYEKHSKTTAKRSWK